MSILQKLSLFSDIVRYDLSLTFRMVRLHFYAKTRLENKKNWHTGVSVAMWLTQWHFNKGNNVFTNIHHKTHQRGNSILGWAQSYRIISPQNGLFGLQSIEFSTYMD